MLADALNLIPCSSVKQKKKRVDFCTRIPSPRRHQLMCREGKAPISSTLLSYVYSSRVFFSSWVCPESYFMGKRIKKKLTLAKCYIMWGHNCFRWPYNVMCFGIKVNYFIHCTASSCFLVKQLFRFFFFGFEYLKGCLC